MRTWTVITASLLVAGNAMASSHREAPGIMNDPAADITDLYSFASPTRANNQVFVMDVSPGYLPVAGPNWYVFDPNVLYEVHIDVDGDAVEDVTYQFQFSNVVNYKDSVDGILSFSGAPITFDDAAHTYSGALSQTYTVTKVTGGRRSGNATVLAAGTLSKFPVAPPRIGPFVTDGGIANKTNDTARYAAYKGLADHANITADKGYMFFAGPRNDPFFVDLGAVFDGVQVRLLNKVLDAASTDTPRDSLAGANVLSIAFEVPVAELNGKANFGVWATTSRPQAAVQRIDGKDAQVGGGWVQVQRLGNPLVNEVVIGVKDKDKFGATQPKDDAANFAGYVVKPQLATILNSLYGSNGAVYKNLISDIPDGTNDGGTPRYDLVDVFVAGIPGFSQIPGATGAGEMLRVNRSLGIEGWPLNGRKLDDDVLAIALSFVAGCKVLPAYNDTDISGIGGDGKAFQANKWADTHKVANPGGGLKPTDPTTPANCLLDDGVTADDKTPGGTGHLADFPYLDLPFAAY